MDREMDKPEKSANGRKTAEYLLELTGAALNESVPGPRPEGCTWQQIWHLACRSNVEAMIWPSVSRFEKDMSPDLYRKWRKRFETMFYRQLRFDMERESIYTEMAAAGLSWLPLKGVVLKDFYPGAGMRFMCDNDILYGLLEKDDEGHFHICGETEAMQEAAVQKAQRMMGAVMKKLGFEEKSLAGNHDSYLKEPIYNFEMHRELMAEKYEMHTYFKNPWRRAIPDQEGADSGAFHFSDEDTYIFVAAHAYKHYHVSGCGIRTLADEYVFLKKKADGMNWDYIEAELEKIHLVPFEKNLRHAAMAAFSQQEKLSDADWHLIMYMLGSGTYGNLNNRIQNQLASMADGEASGRFKVLGKYIHSRLFPDQETVKSYFPMFAKYPFLKVFLPFYRLARGMKKHPKQLLKELDILRKSR